MVIEQMSLFTNLGESAMSPEDRVAMVCHWARNNRDTYRRLLHIVEREAQDPGRRIYKDGKLDHVVPLRREEAYVAAQRQGLSVSEAEAFRFDNNMWSVLSRVMIMQNPLTAAVLKPKKCAVDTVDIRKVWQDSTNAGDFFFAATWDKAASMLDELHPELVA